MMREGGSLEAFDSGMRTFRSTFIRGERLAGKSLRDARLRLDDVLARFRKGLQSGRASAKAAAVGVLVTSSEHTVEFVITTY
jgi:hypothetical protein